jgi:hypothetical protein
MCRNAILAVAVTLLGCSTSREVAMVEPLPPSLRSPICARPAERAAIEVSALQSELQVITIKCSYNDRYNAPIPRLRPALATKEKDLRAFFARAYGARGQTEHDKYITELANLQSRHATKSGPRFCGMNSSMDQVMPLSTVAELATYAEGKNILQALAFDECH